MHHYTDLFCGNFADIETFVRYERFIFAPAVNSFNFGMIAIPDNNDGIPLVKMLFYDLLNIFDKRTCTIHHAQIFFRCSAEHVFRFPVRADEKRRSVWHFFDIGNGDHAVFFQFFHNLFVMNDFAQLFIVKFVEFKRFSDDIKSPTEYPGLF